MRRRGQGSTEYVLVIGVVVLGTTAASYAFVPSFRDGTTAMGRDVKHILATHRIEGDGGAGGTDAAAPAAGGTSLAGTNTGLGGVDGDGQCRGDCSRVYKTADGHEIGNRPQVDGGTQACTQFALAKVLGSKPEAVLADTRREGLTADGTRMSLAQAQQYLQENGRASTLTGGDLAQLQAAIDRGDSVMVIADMKSGNQHDRVADPTCNGQCGHTMTVTKIFHGSDGVDYVALQDDQGLQLVPVADFQKAWAPYGNGMLVVPAA